MRGEEGKRIKVKGTQHRGEEYREEDNLGEHTIPLVHHPSYRLRTVLVSLPRLTFFTHFTLYRPLSLYARTSARYLLTLSPLYPPPRSGRLRRGVTGERTRSWRDKVGNGEVGPCHLVSPHGTRLVSVNFPSADITGMRLMSGQGHSRSDKRIHRS